MTEEQILLSPQKTLFEGSSANGYQTAARQSQL